MVANIIRERQSIENLNDIVASGVVSLNPFIA